MEFKQPGLCYISVMLMLSMAWASHASPEIIVPRLSEIPAVDGRLDESAWQNAVELSVGARIGFDDVALWLALSNLPRRNVLEITLRVTDCMEEQDYFTVDADGKKQFIRQRIGSTSATDAWQAVVQQDGNTWSVEAQIPF